MARIKFEEATQEAFEVFADEAAEALPEASLTYHPTPMLGEPYIVVQVPNEDGFGTYPLIVDVGDVLVVSDKGVRVDEW